ncbi:MAG: hypothetical protein ACXQTV_00020 [Candidatus Hecatellaceae archaeon]
MTTPKVRLGIGSNVVDLLESGNVVRIVQHPVKTTGRRKIAGGEVLIAELGPAETLYVVEGYLDRNAVENLQRLRNLFEAGKPLWLETSSFQAAVKFSGMEIPYQGGFTELRYRLELVEVPFWGRTKLLAGSGSLSDLEEASVKSEILSPLWGCYEWSWNRENKTFNFAFILNGSLEGWLKLETQIPDSLIHDENVKLYAYNPEAGGYEAEAFMAWNAEDGIHGSFNHDVAWLLDGSKLSDYYASAEECLADYPKGSRGEALTALAGNAGKAYLSQTYGCLKRIAYAIKLPAGKQMRLKVSIAYQAEETSFLG